MKTEELTFTEAVIALRDGQCEYIENMEGDRYSLDNPFKLLLHHNHNSGIRLAVNNYLGFWKLGNPTFDWKITTQGTLTYEVKGRTISEALEMALMKRYDITGINLKAEEKERYATSGF